MPRVSLGGVNFNYEDRGSGQPVVFIPGLWMSARFFKRQMEGLGDHYRVVAFDLRAHGQSEHVQSGHTMTQYARDLKAFLEHLQLNDVVLAGWSMGAFVIWDYFKQFKGERVKATIVIDQSASDFKWPDWPYGFADLPTLAHLIATVQTDRNGFVPGFLPNLFRNPPSETELAWMVEEACRLPVSIATSVFFDQTVQDYRPVLPTVNVPTLLTFGRDEKLVPVAAGEHLS